MKRLISFLLAAVLLAAPVFAAQETKGDALPLAASGMVVMDDVLYVADSYHRAVWAVENGEASLLAGRTDVTDLSGQPVAGYADGAFSQAVFSEPWAVVPYLDGLLVSDTANHVLRYLDLEKERVYTAVGTGKAGSQNGSNSRASFDSPTGLAVDDEGTVYIADTGNSVIRAMDKDGKVTTYAGSQQGCALGARDDAMFSEPTGLCWADGVLYVADTGNHRIVAIENDQVTLVAGAALTGDAAYEGDYLNGPANRARFAGPQGVTVDADGTVYVADTGNGAVRMVQDGFVSTLLRMNNNSAYPVSPRGLLPANGTLYVGDVFSRVLFSCSTQGTDLSFDDVADDAWYAQAVRFAAANDLFQGTGEGLFSPDEPMSRAMIWTVLAGYAGVDTAQGSPWYAAGQAWALETAISDGSEPDSTLTREQLATMLYRYVQSQGGGFSDAWMFYLDYADIDQISDYAYEAMCWMSKKGVVTSVGDNQLAPQNAVTRAEAADMLFRLLTCEW